jgi:hypothetical protein
MKWTRTPDSIVPQPTRLPRAPSDFVWVQHLIHIVREEQSWIELANNVGRKICGLHINRLTGKWRKLRKEYFHTLIITMIFVTMPGNFMLLIDCDTFSGKLSYL